MKISLNGENKNIEDSISVAALLETLGVETDLVAVEVNLNIISKPERASRILCEGDVVEIVKFVGGGKR